MTARPLASTRVGEPSRSLGLLCMVAPWPFFLLGVPCAPSHVNVLFRTTCVGYAGFMFFGQRSAKGSILQTRRHGISLFWNMAAAWIISAWWCAETVAWLALIAAELAFVTVSARLFSLGSARWWLAPTLSGSVAGYAVKCQGWTELLDDAVARRLSPAAASMVAPAQGLNASVAAEEEGEGPSEGGVWCIVVFLMVVVLVALMLLLTVGTNHDSEQAGTAYRPTTRATYGRSSFSRVVPEHTVAGDAEAVQDEAMRGGGDEQPVGGRPAVPAPS